MNKNFYKITIIFKSGKTKILTFLEESVRDEILNSLIRNEEVRTEKYYINSKDIDFVQKL